MQMVTISKVLVEKAIKEAIQHYPNGINLTLTFQEILNIDRLRYVQRVGLQVQWVLNRILKQNLITLRNR